MQSIFRLVILVCLLKIFGLVHYWVTYDCCMKNLISRLMILGDLFCEVVMLGVGALLFIDHNIPGCRIAGDVCRLFAML